MDTVGGEGWTLHPQLDQDEEVREERFVLMQRKPFQKVPPAWPNHPAEVWSNGNGVSGQWQQ